MDGFKTKEMEQFYSKHPPKGFRPCAYFDKHLDCIRVQVSDCSFTEIRLNEAFTVYQRNHVSNLDFVGFSIKGIRHLFEEHKLENAKEGPYIVADIIDAMIKANPRAFGDFVQKFFGTDSLNLEVEDLPYSEAA
ncbi:MAG: hypothetical protein M1398_00115 [Deltaproteobacteria bacterium]|nr:hypothetical protein [Deltaproteobacteria bacterium]MDA8306908.1 hypothetical protein [Deltaproteobacteria bacterium]